MGSWFITSQSRFAAREKTPAPNSRGFVKMRFNAPHSVPSSSPATLTLTVPGEKFVSASARISALRRTRRVDDTRYTGAGAEAVVDVEPVAVSPPSVAIAVDDPISAGAAADALPDPVPCVAACSASASSASSLSRSTRISMPPSSRNAAAAAAA